MNIYLLKRPIWRLRFWWYNYISSLVYHPFNYNIMYKYFWALFIIRSFSKYLVFGPFCILLLLLVCLCFVLFIFWRCFGIWIIKVYVPSSLMELFCGWVSLLVNWNYWFESDIVAYERPPWAFPDKGLLCLLLINIH